MKHMKRVIGGTAFVGLLTASFLAADPGDWTVSAPVEDSSYGPTADIAVAGMGPFSTAATAKFVRQSDSSIRDSFNFTVNSMCADCGFNPGSFPRDDQVADCVFDISGSWTLNTHLVEIWVSGNKEYPETGHDGHSIFIVN